MCSCEEQVCIETQLSTQMTVLGGDIKEVLDRRKNGLLDTSAMSDQQRSSLAQQLMALVANLEEEMFQAEAHKFEAEVILAVEF